MTTEERNSKIAIANAALAKNKSLIAGFSEPVLMRGVTASAPADLSDIERLSPNISGAGITQGMIFKILEFTKSTATIRGNESERLSATIIDVNGQPRSIYASALLRKLPNAQTSVVARELDGVPNHPFPAELINMDLGILAGLDNETDGFRALALIGNGEQFIHVEEIVQDKFQLKIKNAAPGREVGSTVDVTNSYYKLSFITEAEAKARPATA